MAKGVTDLRYVGYAVTDFEAERAFYARLWGLREVANDGRLAFFAAEGSDEPFIVRLRKAEHVGLDLIGLAVDAPAEVAALHARLSESGVKIVRTPGELSSPGGGYGFRLFDPDGRVLEISADVARGPRRELERGESIPRELSHVVLHSPDRAGLEAFYTQQLGFRVSDWIGDFMTFLRCNPVHHRLAVLPGPPALNHVAFEMRNADEMMRGLSRLKAEGLALKWGPGRHTAGNNTFSYFQSPNGHIVEYTAEVDRVDEATWQPTRYAPRKEIMDQWGTAEGGPDHMPHPRPDPALWQALTV